MANNTPGQSSAAARSQRPPNNRVKNATQKQPGSPEIRQSVRAAADMSRKVDTLASIADQGEYRQNNILS